METVLIYLIKVSALLTLFLSAYQLFLKKETFFKVNRRFLLVGIITALTLPFVTITKYVEAAPIVYKTLSNSATNITSNITTNEFDWMQAIFILYSCGVIMLSVKFLIQLYSLYKLYEGCKVTKHGNFYHVEMDKDLAPFSFFNYIFFNPNLYSGNELSAIIKHENAHSSQWHSVDVLLSHLVAIFTWVNPVSWLYQKHIKQNLEFLADESAIKEEPSIKKYQYTLLRVAGNYSQTPLVNHFYNSLIKKRIVMLNKSKSNKRSLFKIALIIPALAVFLVSFNTKEAVIPIDPTERFLTTVELPSKTIELIIDKNTTDKELSEMKNDLSKKGIDFSYTVVRNSNKEISGISIDFATTKDDGKKMRSSSNYDNGDEPIDPIFIIYDEGSNSISIGNHENMPKTIHVIEDIHFDEDHDGDEYEMIWVTTDGGKEKHKTIEITDKNGKETIKVNGKKVSRKEFEKIKDAEGIHEEHIKIKKAHSDKKGNTFILKKTDKKVHIDSDGDENVFVMKMSSAHNDSDTDIIAVQEDKGKSMFFISSDDDEKPLYVIDGKASKEKDMKKLEADTIESINVLKGEYAEIKYGKKGKNGVVEITTKKE